jgi:hypothetical protein
MPLLALDTRPLRRPERIRVVREFFEAPTECEV